MWKLVCILCVLPLLLSPTTADDNETESSTTANGRDPRSLLDKGLSLLRKTKLMPEIPVHSTLVPFWSRSKMGNFTCEKVGTYPFPNSCNHFIKCATLLGHYYYFVYKCGGNRIYSITGEGCVLPEAADRDDCRAGTTTGVTDVTGGTNSTEDDTKTLEEIHQNLLLRTDNGNCVEEGYHGVETNCSQFYRCVLFGNMFTRFDFVCPPGTIWDDDLKTCNFRDAIEHVTCTDGPQIDYPVYDPNVIYYQNFQLTDNQSVYVCPSDMRRHSKYCNVLYQCYYENPYLSLFHMHCPLGTWFDDQKVQCVSTPPPSDCTMIDDVSLLSMAMNISNLEPLCPTATSLTSASTKPCETEFVKCRSDEFGDIIGAMRTCVGSVFDLTRQECVLKSDVPECVT